MRLQLVTIYIILHFSRNMSMTASCNILKSKKKIVICCTSDGYLKLRG